MHYMQMIHTFISFCFQYKIWPEFPPFIPDTEIFREPIFLLQKLCGLSAKKQFCNMKKMGVKEEFRALKVFGLHGRLHGADST